MRTQRHESKAGTWRSAMLKYQRVVARLRDAIRGGELPVGERVGSVRALSKRFGLSTATIYQALKELQSRGLLEMRVGSGCYVARTTEIGPARLAPLRRGEILTFHLWDWETAQRLGVHGRSAVNGAINEARGYGLAFRMIQFPAEGSQPEFIRRTVRQEHPVGVLLLSLGTIENTRTAVDYLRADGVPVVVMHPGYRVDVTGVPSVAPDQLNAGALAADILLERGASSIGSVAWLYVPSEQRLVVRGAQAAFEDAGRAPSDFLFDNTAPDCMQLSGYRLTRKLLAQRRDLDGFIYPHELLAEGGTSYLVETGRIPGRDVHVVALPFEQGAAERTHAGVTWLRFPYERVGRESMRALVGQIERHGGAARIRVPAEVVRNTEINRR